ncbi:hypothetical protein ACFPYI_17095 [Halomarina salina]|uniref:Uncharacterized protein n=1 Tax=Halomarina salina TaxID=1872699 RepID=A0ABD5RRA6_9EURY|nr:hypothetical protein [Halomarina salina]
MTWYTFVRPYLRPLGISIVGLHATFATLGAVATESVFTLGALVLTLVLAGAVGLHAHGRGPLVPTVLGAGYTLAAAFAVTLAVPLGALGPMPADAFASLSWRTVASVVFFALFAGAPCYALAALSLVGGRPNPMLIEVD